MGYIKWNYELLKEYMNSLGYELLSKEYIDNSIKIIFKDKDGFILTSLLNNLRAGWIPRAFDINNSYTIENIIHWIENNNKKYNLISEKYNGTKKLLECKCLNNDCGEIFPTNWSSISNNIGCAYCCKSPQRVGLSNCLATKNPKLAKEWHTTLNGNLTPYDVTSKSNKKVWWQCSKNPEHTWNTSIEKRSRGENCPYCTNYIGEIKIEKVLRNMKIYFKQQFGFSDCKYINTLSFDFYIPDLNICIEYQGLQHYKPVDFANKGEQWAKEQFIINQIKDQIKKEYCNKNNIKLIEIPYWDFDNVEKIIEKEVIYNEFYRKKEVV